MPSQIAFPHRALCRSVSDGMCTRMCYMVGINLGRITTHRTARSGADAGAPAIAGSGPVPGAHRTAPPTCACDRTSHRLPAMPPWAPWAFMLSRLRVFLSVFLSDIRLFVWRRVRVMSPAPPRGRNAARAWRPLRKLSSPPRGGRERGREGPDHVSPAPLHARMHSTAARAAQRPCGTCTDLSAARFPV